MLDEMYVPVGRAGFVRSCVQRRQQRLHNGVRDGERRFQVHASEHKEAAIGVPKKRVPLRMVGVPVRSLVFSGVPFGHGAGRPYVPLSVPVERSAFPH